MSFFSKIKEKMKATRDSLSGRVDAVLKSFTKIDENFLEELEEILILSDLGSGPASDAVNRLRAEIKRTGASSPEEVRNLLKEILVQMLGTTTRELKLETTPSIILIVGVNGVGKTTSIGKLAAMFKNSGRRPIIAAADTFRAAAADQLTIWAGRAGVEIIKHGEGGDPAAVVFDTAAAARARGNDLIIVDTAGRLHNKQNLMNELSKINRVLNREFPDCNVETLLVIDATTGQNAINQAREFSKAAGVTGVIVTKLDGTAKGGASFAVSSTLGLPIRFVGVGEGIDDLLPFDPKEFVEAIFDR